MDPIVDSESTCEEILAAAKKRPADIFKIKKCMTSHPDLIHGCMYPETDVDLVIAIIMRFLHDNIFQKILFGIMPGVVEVLTFTEGSMQTNVQPKRGESLETRSPTWVC
jgi:hypothetical protein